MKTRFIALVGTLFFSFLALVFAQSNNWNIAANSGGQVSTMTIDNPVTFLQIEKQLVLNVGRQDDITSGTVLFKNGVQRNMEKQEAATYFTTLGGQRALWNYWQSHNLLRSLSTGQSIPNEWYGKKSRFITASGIEVYGTLSSTGNAEPDQAAIVAENASGGPIVFSMKVISQLQHLR
jgi:hypothetical protein